jgi:hypothetical protein
MIGRTNTSRPIAAFLAAFAAVSLASCGEDESPPSTPDAGARPHADLAPPTPVGPPTAVRKADGAPEGLANGRHAVFGLRMPQGMTPAGTPQPGVYRFEGPHPPGVVESFLTDQLASFDPPVPEPSAKLIRNAVVRKPIGGVAAAPLAIRLHERQDGTQTDVWQERMTDTADTTLDTSFGAPGSAAAQPSAPASSSGTYRTPADRRRAAFEVLQKIERGEPLTKQDLDNPMFQ